MGAKLSLRYDRAADIAHIGKCPPYAEQESEETGDDIIARLNPKTGDVEISRRRFSPHHCSAMNFSNCH
jgi:hypothetical protein